MKWTRTTTISEKLRADLEARRNYDRFLEDKKARFQPVLKDNKKS